MAITPTKPTNTITATCQKCTKRFTYKTVMGGKCITNCPKCTPSTTKK